MFRRPSRPFIPCKRPSENSSARPQKPSKSLIIPNLNESRPAGNAVGTCLNNERNTVDKLKITANGPLNGEITVSGAKNAALPLMCAGLLTAGTLRLKNVPMLADVKTTQKLLQGMARAC